MNDETLDKILDLCKDSRIIRNEIEEFAVSVIRGKEFRNEIRKGLLLLAQSVSTDEELGEQLEKLISKEISESFEVLMEEEFLHDLSQTILKKAMKPFEKFEIKLSIKEKKDDMPKLQGKSKKQRK